MTVPGPSETCGTSISVASGSFAGVSRKLFASACACSKRSMRCRVAKSSGRTSSRYFVRSLPSRRSASAKISSGVSWSAVINRSPTRRSIHSARNGWKLPQLARKVLDVARIFECIEEKSLGVRPIAVGSCPRNAERLGSVLVSHAGKISKFDELGLDRRLRRESNERLIDSQNFAGVLVGEIASRIDVVSFQSATALRTKLLPSSFDEDSTH